MCKALGAADGGHIPLNYANSLGVVLGVVVVVVRMMADSSNDWFESFSFRVNTLHVKQIYTYTKINIKS